MSSTSTETLDAAAVVTPIQTSERIYVVDILRGFALLGILLVNMHLFIHPLQTLGLPPPATDPSVDRAAAWFVRFIAEGKFISLFSLLFGLGFTIQMSRAAARGAHFVGLYTRRLLVLLAIGLAHAFFIWVGDILTLYAVLGFLLILYRNVKPRTLLIWAAVFLTLPMLLVTLQVAAIQAGRAVPETRQQIERTLAEHHRAIMNGVEQGYRVYPEGNFVEVTKQRASDMSFAAAVMPSTAPSVFGMFLIGAYFGRREIFRHVDEHRTLFRRMLWWGLIVGLMGNLIFATLSMWLTRYDPTPPVLLALLGLALGAPAMCLFYVAAVTLLVNDAKWGKRLAVLVPFGRMALTNYLGQSVICTLIFYGYGLGLFGRVGTAAGLLLALAVYSAQLVFSYFWMKRFRFGPAEWLWRSLTYMKWQPLSK